VGENLPLVPLAPAWERVRVRGVFLFSSSAVTRYEGLFWNLFFHDISEKRFQVIRVYNG